MNNTANTTNKNLQKGFNELQIDANLANDTEVTAQLTFEDTPVSNRTQNDNVDHANATGSTTPLTFKTPVSNRTTQNDDVDYANATGSNFETPASNRTQNDDDISDDWKNFYKTVDKSPHKDVRGVSFSDAVVTANEWLHRSQLKGFETFDDLDNDQKAIMMLMITKKMDACFEGYDSRQRAKILVGALIPASDAYKRIMAFVRKGGDTYVAGACRIVNEQFAPICQEFEENSGITIFTRRKDMKPFLRFQRENSFICSFTACYTLLHYHTYNNENQLALKTNLSRYIRNEIDGTKIANLTLTTEKGAFLHEILDGVLTSFGDDGRACYTFELFKNNIDLNYRILRELLEDGRPFALTMEVFPGFNYCKTKRFAGEISDYYKRAPEPRPTNPKDRSYHAVVCIGIKPRDGITPPMLLLQDSSKNRPTFSLGLDLLMSMGEETSLICVIPENWVWTTLCPEKPEPPWQDPP